MVRLLLALPQYSVTFDDCVYIPKMFFDLKYKKICLFQFLYEMIYYNKNKNNEFNK